MTPFSRFVIAVAMASLPILARGEGKCEDDPKVWVDPAGVKHLVVTWSIPVPADATVDHDPTGTLLADLDTRFGSEPAGFPSEYSINLETTAFLPHPETKKKLDNTKAVEDWLLKHFDIRLEPEVKPALEDYFKNKRWIYGRVVEHPPALQDGLGYRFCTCTLQRAAVVFDWSRKGKEEELWVRTRFRSARDQLTFVNFVPRTPVVFTFQAGKVWFPLALNRILPEPGKPAFLLLDVLSRKPLALDQIPAAFGRQAVGTIVHAGATWHVTRIWRQYHRGDPASDLLLDVPR